MLETLKSDLTSTEQRASISDADLGFGTLFDFKLDKKLFLVFFLCKAQISLM